MKELGLQKAKENQKQGGTGWVGALRGQPQLTTSEEKEKPVWERGPCMHDLVFKAGYQLWPDMGGLRVNL